MNSDLCATHIIKGKGDPRAGLRQCQKAHGHGRRKPVVASHRCMRSGGRLEGGLGAESERSYLIELLVEVCAERLLVIKITSDSHLDH